MRNLAVSLLLAAIVAFIVGNAIATQPLHGDAAGSVSTKQLPQEGFFVDNGNTPLQFVGCDAFPTSHGHSCGGIGLVVGLGKNGIEEAMPPNSRFAGITCKPNAAVDFECGTELTARSVH